MIPRTVPLPRSGHRCYSLPMPKREDPGRRKEDLFFNWLKFLPAKTLERRAFRTLAIPVLGGKVLDIGGGLGPYRKYLSGSPYFCVEINPSLRLHIVGSAADLPVRANAVDCALCNEVLEHLPDPAAAVREI